MSYNPKSKRKIILIGGAPTSGKSVLTRRLAKQLELPWISTDLIREMMRMVVDKKRYTHLFHFPGRTAQSYLSTHTAAKIVENQNNESRDVWKGVKALIDTDYVWKSYIIEGVAVLPHLVRRSYGQDKTIRPIFLTAEDPKRIRKIVFTRGLWDDAHKYPDSVKEKEVEWVLEFNRWLKKEAKKY